MTPVPLPPPHDVWTTCRQAWEAWGAGRVRSDSLVNGAIVLADGTRCPVADSLRPELAETGASWVPLALGAVLALVVAGVLALIVSERRGEEG